MSIQWSLVFTLALGLLLGHILVVCFDALLGLMRSNRTTTPG